MENSIRDAEQTAVVIPGSTKDIALGDPDSIRVCKKYYLTTQKKFITKII